MIFDATSLLHFSIFLLVFEHVTVAAQFFGEMLLQVVDLAAVELLNAVLLMVEAVEDQTQHFSLSMELLLKE